MKMQIRDATVADTDTVASYNARLAEETEGRVLDRERLDPGVRAALEDPDKARYWVAEVGETVVGQIMVTQEWSDWRNGTFWWIQSVYVLPDYRRQGVFASLYRHVESLARETGNVCGLRLYVERDNRPARQTYEALGMTDPGYRVMETDFQK